MEPATPQAASGSPSSGARRHRTLQTVLLFSLVLLLVLIGAMLTGAFGAKTTVSSAQATATANAKAGISGSFAGGDSALAGTVTDGALTPLSLTPGSGQDGTLDASQSGDASSNGGSIGPKGGANSGAAPASGANGNNAASNPSGANGNSSGTTNGGNGLANSLPGGTNSNPGSANSSASGSSGSATGGSFNGSTGSSTGNSGAPANAGSSANGAKGTASGSLPGGTNSNPASTGTASNLPSPHLGNYVCATGNTGNLTYQSDFTILEGLKYKHSTSPSQEFSFSYDSKTQAIHWLDGPNAGTVGSYYLPDGARSYRIVEQFPNNPQAAPVSCMLAEK